MIKKTIKISATLLFMLSVCQISVAQEVVWDAGFHFFFDNREYKSNINWPQTIFGARLAPEIGIKWDQQHSLMVGASLLSNFGATPFDDGVEGFMYYGYESEKFKIKAGVVPRSKLNREYPSAFFSDSIAYHDPNITGLTFQTVGRRGYFEFTADWNSMLGEERREKFILFSTAGLYLDRNKEYTLGFFQSMYHHAGTITEDGVVDNVLLYPFVGLDLSKRTSMQQLNFRVGWMQSFQNDRKYVGKYVTPGGFQLELSAQKWNFGVSNTLYSGNNLMPYFIAPQEGLDYGPGLYWGEPFYRTSTIYDRLELYWQPVDNDIMRLRLSSVHHYDGKSWDNWQQKIIFTVKLGQRRLFQ